MEAVDRKSSAGAAIRRTRDRSDTAKTVSEKVKSSSSRETADPTPTARTETRNESTSDGSASSSDSSSSDSSETSSSIRATVVTSSESRTQVRTETSTSNFIAWQLQRETEPSSTRALNETGSVNGTRLAALSTAMLSRTADVEAAADDPAAAGAADAEELIELTETSPNQLTDADLERLEELNQNLAENAENEAYTAAFFNTLGPERAAQLPSRLSEIARIADYGTDGELDLDYASMGDNLSVALGTASRSGQLSNDYADRLRRAAGPTAEAIYLSKGTFEPEFVADLADDVFRYHDPNLTAADQAFEVPGGRSPELGGHLFGFEDASFNDSTFNTALDAVERSGAELHVLQREGIVDRILSPGFEIQDPQTAETMARVLDAPRRALESGYSSYAIDAASNLVEATILHEGVIADHADEAIAALYVDHADAILNVGVDQSNAWGIDTAFGRALADGDSERLPAGSAHYVIAAAAGADGLHENGLPWEEAVVVATIEFRDEVLRDGPRTDSQDSAIVWGNAVGQIDTELIQGFGLRGVIDGRIEDEMNASRRFAIDTVTDILASESVRNYAPQVGYSALALNFVEDYGFDALLPIDNELRAEEAIAPELRNQIAATQWAIFDQSIRSGDAEDIPPELLADPSDPSQGLRVPTDAEDAAKLQEDVLAYIETLPPDSPVRAALHAATNQLERAAADR